MPYLNSLAQTYAYSEGYFANTHPSIGNYFMLTTGQVITNDDTYTSTVSADNIVRHLIATGLTWKEYSGNLPYVGYVGGDTGPYTEHRNPLSYLSDVRGSSSQTQNLVPVAQLAADIASHNLPNYAMIVPGGVYDAHDCPTSNPSCTDDEKLAQADQWLQANIGPLIKSSDFNTPGGGLVVVTFDESYQSNTVMGGGKVAWVVAGPDVKQGYVSAFCYQHANTLRFMSAVIGLTTYPGTAASAGDMREFLNGN